MPASPERARGERGAPLTRDAARVTANGEKGDARRRTTSVRMTWLMACRPAGVTAPDRRNCDDARLLGREVAGRETDSQKSPRSYWHAKCLRSQKECACGGRFRLLGLVQAIG